MLADIEKESFYIVCLSACGIGITIANFAFFHMFFEKIFVHKDLHENSIEKKLHSRSWRCVYIKILIAGNDIEWYSYNRQWTGNVCYWSCFNNTLLEHICHCFFDKKIVVKGKAPQPWQAVAQRLGAIGI